MMVGRTVNQYRFIEKLGAGGMGEIYKAQDLRLNRFVAIKVLTSANAGDPERRRRFLQEAQAASALNHPNIITIHDIISEGESEFLVMEYIAGRTLIDLIPKGGLRVPQVLKYAVQMADALQAAHAAGIIHRDLKPGNVMATDAGLVKVLDFGLAKLTDRGAFAGHADDATQTIAEAPLTVEGAIIGTVSYMSPEQAQGRRVDARSDIFSFGLVLYEMCTGLRAFTGDSALSTLSAILRDDVRPMVEVAPDVPPELESVIAKCLKKNPDDRWQDIREMQQVLTALKYNSDSGMLYRSRLSGISAPGSVPLAGSPPAAPPPMAPAGGPPVPPPMDPYAAPVAGPSSGVGAPPMSVGQQPYGMPPQQPGYAPPMPPPSMQPPSGQQRPAQAGPQGGKKKSSAGLVLALVGIVVLAAAGAGAWWYTHRPAPEPVQPPPVVAEAPPEPPPQPVAEPAPPAMTNADVLAMVEAKTPVAEILARIQTAPGGTNFDLSPQETARLAKARVPAIVIEQMRTPATPVSQATSAKSAPPPAAKTAAPAPKSVPPPAVSKGPAPPPAAVPATVTPAAPEPPKVAPKPAAPAPATVSVMVNDGLPFAITLSQNIPEDAEQGMTLRFTAANDFRVGDTIVVAKGATITGQIVEGSRRGLIRRTKMTMKLMEADTPGGQKLKVRAVAGRRSDGDYQRPVETPTKPKGKGVEADAGAPYIAYVDGQQTLTVHK